MKQVNLGNLCEWPVFPVKTQFMTEERALNHYLKLFPDHLSYVSLHVVE